MSFFVFFFFSENTTFCKQIPAWVCINKNKNYYVRVRWFVLKKMYPLCPEPTHYRVPSDLRRMSGILSVSVTACSPEEWYLLSRLEQLLTTQ